MAGKLKNIKNSLKNTKTRTLLIVGVVVVVIAITIGWLGIKRAENKEAPAGANIQGAPAIQSVPGVGTPSREYIKTQEQENILKAERAAREGTSAIPTITRTTYIESPGAPLNQAGAVMSVECTPEALARARQAGVRVEELRCKGCSATQLRSAGYTAGEMMNAGFGAADLKAAGFGADELRQAGFGAAELARAGFSPSELMAAGFSAAELNQAGIGADRLTAAGATAQQLAAAGIGVTPSKNLPKDCSVAALQQARSQGVSAADLRRKGCSATALRAAGYTAKELKDAGFSAKELKDAGFSAKELKDAGFTAGELRQAGFSANDLKDAGFTAADLRDAGFSAEELAAAGFAANDLADAGFSNGELVRAGLQAAPATTVSTLVTPTQPGQPATTVTTTTTSAVPAISLPEDSNIAALERLQQRQAEQLSQQERQDRISQLQQTMAQQAGDLFSTWSPPTIQQYIRGPEEKQSTYSASQAAANAAAAALAAQQMPFIKAGTIMFAVLDTALNSDEPGPILATVVSGPYKDARLIGQFQRENKKVLLSFVLMSIDSLPQSIPIDAVAIDPNTARTALASNVDSHYLLRYGTLFASSFIAGLGEAVQNSGSTTNVTLAGVSTTYPALSAAEKGLVALGNVGQTFGNQLATFFNRPPTVMVDAGIGLGILFRSDVAIPVPGAPVSTTVATTTTAATAIPTTTTTTTNATAVVPTTQQPQELGFNPPLAPLPPVANPSPPSLQLPVLSQGQQMQNQGTPTVP